MFYSSVYPAVDVRQGATGRGYDPEERLCRIRLHDSTAELMFFNLVIRLSNFFVRSRFSAGL